MISEILTKTTTLTSITMIMICFRTIITLEETITIKWTEILSKFLVTAKTWAVAIMTLVEIYLVIWTRTRTIIIPNSSRKTTTKIMATIQILTFHFQSEHKLYCWWSSKITVRRLHIHLLVHMFQLNYFTLCNIESDQ